MSLTTYKRKRDFSKTPEPARGGETGRRIFVVQLHHASHRHFDFRLELDGALKSWAIPKGPSLDPSVKRLAVEVEDHPVSYASFEGDIPKGNYGAGHVDVFDSGIWEPIGDARKGLTKGELKFVLHGDVLRGSWVLVRTRKQAAKQQWLLIKHQDDYARPCDANEFVDPETDRPLPLNQRKKIWSKITPRYEPPTPAADATIGKLAAIKSEPFKPELCKSVEGSPDGERWLHEVKWDGYRILATVVRGKARLWSRNGIEWTAKIPKLAQAVEALGFKNAQLDGEIIALHGERESFNALQSHLSGDTKTPPIYMLFDLLHVDGRSLWDVPLIERKKLLAQRLLARPHELLRYSEHQIGHGSAVFAQATSAGLEGIVSKRADSHYSGARSGAWVKAKGRPTDEFVVVGFTEPKGNRPGIGALLLATPDKQGELTYVGRVGTGFSDQQLRDVRTLLDKSVIEKTPAVVERMAAIDRRLAIWVEPRLIGEVFHQGYGGKGLLRQVAFKTFRPDKTVEDLMPAARSNQNLVSAKSVTKKASTSELAKKHKDALDVDITHPERTVYPEAGISKGDVADYYRAVAEWILPELEGRPLSVVRCPDGVVSACFFQKHAGRGWGKNVHKIDIQEKTGRDEYLSINDAKGLLELVQMNVLEFHPWGSPKDDPEKSSRIIFDLDPDPSVAWKRVVAAAREVRDQLASIGLTSFVRTSGGKGLHVVVPLNPPADWEDVRRFSEGVAQALANLHPDEFVAVATKAKRKGKIFIDWLRNTRGATSVASYSLRARAKAGVAMPVSWEELGRVKSGDAFTMTSALTRLKRRKVDPWAAFANTQQGLPDV